MLKKMLFVVAFLFAAVICITCGAADIEVVKNGKSDYQIVVPGKSKDKNIDGFIKSSAELLQNCITEATGVSLPIVEEFKYDKTKPAIFIGDTAFARADGIDIAKMENWSYVNKAVGKNIILAGMDRPNVPGQKASHYTNCILGSVKAVTLFLQDNAGVKFLLPGANGIEVAKQSVISCPEDLNINKKPLMLFNTGRPAELFYDIANNYYSCNGFKLYGGHSYYDAVPKAVYGKSNPEFFALIGNKRNSNSNHLCISNPRVQDVIYAEMLKWLDLGYDSVELGQTDGYMSCECAECAKLFGISDEHEKLWILHRNLAERLLKDRPGKRVVIISYEPTANPPVTFKEFPENVMIELCSYSPESFEKWKDYKVPQGFMAYIYNWGDFQRVGFTPRRTPLYCRTQAELFVKNHVKGIYKCGFGELFGLEGPAYYTFGRSFENSDKMPNAEILADEFCKAAYGKAYVPMKKFFDTLNERLELYSSVETFMGGRNLLPANPRIILTYNYSPDVLEIMENNLQAAEKVADTGKVKKRLQLVRAEFEYLKNLASILHLYNAYKINPGQLYFDKLGDLIEKRNAMINSYYDEKGNMKKLDGWPDIKFLGNSPKEMVMVNGRLIAPINSPLTWNIKQLKDSKILPGTLKKQVTVYKTAEAVAMDCLLEKGAWKNVPFEELGEIQMGSSTRKTQMKLLYDDDNLYIAFEASLPDSKMEIVPAGHDGPCWQQECIEIFLDPFAGKEIIYHLIFNPADKSSYDALNSMKRSLLDPRYGKDDTAWDGKWEYKNKIDEQSKKWISVVKIPFDTLKVSTPSAGTVWYGNFGREHHISRKGAGGVIEYHLWSPNLETISFGDREAFGDIIFAGEKK
jgi:hypothetical protein